MINNLVYVNNLPLNIRKNLFKETSPVKGHNLTNGFERIDSRAKRSGLSEFLVFAFQVFSYLIEVLFLYEFHHQISANQDFWING